MEDKQFLSLPEAAARMGISRIAVFKKVKNGRLPGIRIGRNWAVPAEALQAPKAGGAVGGAARTAPPPAPGPAITPAARRPPAPPPPPPPDSDPLDEMGWD